MFQKHSVQRFIGTATKAKFVGLTKIRFFNFMHATELDTLRFVLPVFAVYP